MLKIKFGKYIQWVILISLVLLLANCGNVAHQESQKSLEINWLSNPKCNGGCVFGIEPGKTTYDETYPILTEYKKEIESDTIENGNYFDYGLNKEVKYINFRFTNPNYGCSISFVDNLADRIDISGMYGRTEIITIGEMVEFFGEPDMFSQYRSNPEGKGCFINFLWNDLRIVATAYDGKVPLFGNDLCKKLEKNNYRVSKDLHIGQILLLNQDWFNEFNRGDEPNWVGFVEDN